MVPGGLTLVACLGALLLSLGARVQADDVIHKAVGSDVTLVPKFTGSPSEINWKVDGNKLVEMELSPYRRKFYRLEDRATIDKKDGRLTITKLVIGDTGQYKAEVLVNNNINYTTINLIILECPSLPTVKNRTVADNTLELDCESSTPNVKYEWKKGAKHLSDHQLFNVSRTNELVYLTCVVSNDACERNVTVTIHPLHSNNSKMIGGVIGVVVVAFLIAVILILCCPRRKPTYKYLRPKRNCGSVSPKFSCDENIQRVKIRIDDLYIKIKRGDGRASVIILSLSVTLDKVKKRDHYCADITLQNGQTYRIEERQGQKGKEDGALVELVPADNVTLTRYGKEIELAVQRAEEVKTIALNKNNETLYDLSVMGPNLKINDMTLVTGENHLLIQNLKDSGKYQVDLYSILNHISSYTFNLEASQDLFRFCKKKPKVKMIVKRELNDSLPKNAFQDLFNCMKKPNLQYLEEGDDRLFEIEPPKDDPIESITFHPNITNVKSSNWTKKEGSKETPVANNEKTHKGTEGELTIKNVQPGEEGIYVYSGNPQMEQEFQFH